MESELIKPSICVIGGANVDIIGIPDNSFIIQDSNPGRISISCGGVGRNIAENLSLLGITTHLVTAISDDLYGKLILEHAITSKIHMEHSIVMHKPATSVYLAILNEKGDMLSAISQMDIYNKITIEHIETRRKLIESCNLCILDTNLPEHIIEYVVNSFTSCSLMLDTVSSSKALRARHVLKHFHTIKPNKVEAEALWGRPINSTQDALEACSYFISLGVTQVFITLGKDGVCYSNGKSFGHFIPPIAHITNATGAGDAFSAAIAYCHLNDYSIEDTARFASAASALTLSHEKTINPGLSIYSINSKIKEWRL